MGMVGTFDGFTTARLGIYAAQKGLMVTGNNISNINTVGYTRQRLDQVSLKTGGNDMYRSFLDNHVGSGALVSNINQIRDPYLDIRYRNTSSDVGYSDTWLSGLQEIADTLDEVGKGFDTNKYEEGDGILYAQLRDLRDMLMQLHNDPNSANDTLVRNSAETLCQLFNSYSKALETMRQDTEADFYNKVDSVNEILTNIRNLNESIREAEICGDNALEMRDERNRQIDSLSELMHIKVEYTMEDIGAGKEVEKLIISLADDNPDPTVKTDSTVLVNGIYGSQIYVKYDLTANPDYDPADPDSLPYLDNLGNPCGKFDPNIAKVYDDNYTIMVSQLVDRRNMAPQGKDVVMNVGRPVELEDNDLFGSLQAMRELLTEKGEFTSVDTVNNVDPKASTRRGIPYYQLSLDLLAQKFAQVYNDLNQGPLLDQDGNLLGPVTGTLKELEELGIKFTQAADTDGGFGDGYYLNPDGTFMGTTAHMNDATVPPTPCILDRVKISATDTVEQAIDKIRTVSPGFADDGAGGYAADAADQLKAFMQDHGVNNTNMDTEKVTLDAPINIGGPLFSNRNDRDDTDGITAATISVSHSWSTGDVQVVPKFKILFDGDVQDSTQNVNIDHMISKIEEALVYNPQDLVPDAVSSKLFTGSFNDMFSNMTTTLGNDQRTLNVQLYQSYAQKVDLDSSREGVSGVDLNDEAMNIMQYQKAYSAACRMMTAIDEAIERLINNTGIAGR